MGERGGGYRGSGDGGRTVGAELSELAASTLQLLPGSVDAQQEERRRGGLQETEEERARTTADVEYASEGNTHSNHIAIT